jgi:hypothetical protein
MKTITFICRLCGLPMVCEVDVPNDPKQAEFVGGVIDRMSAMAAHEHCQAGRTGSDCQRPTHNDP